jgi:non-specific serine/threonine protein kinase
MHMARRLALDAPVRRPDNDAEVLRQTASAANEIVDAVQALSGPRLNAALTQVAQRYGRALGIGSRDVGDALKAANEALRQGAQAQARASGAAVPTPTTEAEPTPVAE